MLQQIKTDGMGMEGMNETRNGNAAGNVASASRSAYRRVVKRNEQLGRVLLPTRRGKRRPEQRGLESRQGGMVIPAIASAAAAAKRWASHTRRWRQRHNANARHVVAIGATRYSKGGHTAIRSDADARRIGQCRARTGRRHARTHQIAPRIGNGGRRRRRQQWKRQPSVEREEVALGPAAAVGL